MLWGLGVGYVISGMYFGWNLGLPAGGPWGMLAATLIVTVLYVCFVFSYAELSCAMPKAGGAFVYAHRALGPRLGFLAGVAQCVEFIFAPPAIAAAIGAYFSIFFPQAPALGIAVLAYILFTGLNILGVRHSAIFELVVAALAVVELVIFAGFTLPSFSWAAFNQNPLPNGWWGIVPALPFAIWFYLGIEGIANVAEETRNPQKDLAGGFGWAMVTLVVLAGLVFFGAVGVSGWEAIVFKTGGEASDSPLPMALARVVGEGNLFYHLLISIGICGLVASFHGLILVAGRATFEFGRIGYAPKWLGHVLPKRGTPAPALIGNMLLGIVALLTGRTAEIITLSVFGALTLYALAMISLLKLRRDEPNLVRPFRTPFYPVLPWVALTLSLLCLIALAYSNPTLALVYGAILASAFVWFVAAVPLHLRNPIRKAVPLA